MRTLLLLRHAKSSWAKPDLRDHDRPLNERGLRDAPRIGRWLAKIGQIPQLILTSTAKRALTTSQIVDEEGQLNAAIEQTSDLYLAPPEIFVRLLRETEDKYDRVMMVAHNPGIETLIELLTGEYESVPTGGLAQIEFDVESWLQVDINRQGRLIDFYRPREIDI